MEQINEFFFKLRKMLLEFIYSDNFKYLFYGIVVLLSSLLLVSIIKMIQTTIREKRKYKNILQINNQTVRELVNQTEKYNKLKVKKQNPIVKLFKDYEYYGGNTKKLIFKITIGYFLTSFIFMFVTKNIAFGFILGCLYLTFSYIFIDSKNIKHEKKFIKGFSQSIRTLSTTISAGNTLEAGFQTIMNRENIDEKIRNEFARINNDLTNNKSLDETMEDFYKRNSQMQEVALFSIVIQFFAKTGGANMKKILAELEDSVNKRTLAYEKVSAEMGANQILMNTFIYGFGLFVLVMPIFQPTFYTAMSDSGIVGYAKIIGSVLTHLLATIMYKSMVRRCVNGG